MVSDAELKVISIDLIKEPLEQERTVIELEGLEDLAKSIQLYGVIQPIIVIKKGENFEVCAGHRRYLAAKMAGLALVPCMVREFTDQENDLIKIHENSFRENVNPVDEARFFLRIKDKHGMSLPEIAKLANRSEGYVTNRIKLLQTDERVLKALEGNLINFSQAVEIDKSTDENVRFELLRVVIESGATVETLRGMRYDFERSLRGQGSPAVGGDQAAGSYRELKHLINCPVCEGVYPVNQIYPISVCKTCYDNFMRELG